MSNPNLSFVIPLLNESESLPELHAWIQRVMNEHQFTYEVLFIDDGSIDGSWEIIMDLHQKDENVHGIRFRRNYGKSAALNVGFEATIGDVIITMDADLQDSPEEIPDLYKMITVDGYDLVSGWKKKRYDPLSKTIPTKLFNWATRKMSGIELNDFNCGLKAYRSDVVKSIEVYGEMHRYIPVIAKWAGFRKIGEKAVQHQERKYGTTKFGLERFINGFLDLLSITFVSKFGKKPMHLFGSIGTLMFVIGFLFTGFLGIQKLYFIAIHERAPLITDTPWFYMALVTMLIGVQLFLSGFIAEMVSRNSPDRNTYQEKERI
ncbi:MAG: glycosyltransferase family 2 protein [Salibacteraceae bacterium]|jgi:glycosyltransferase involved in cell wall biosynthesis|nr:glycosyltransferase family 2 protein [Salibacteraceae bacterium]MDP4688079.1 glycosyltransferase family 2 protein [Salibacteraceae bacterium]MDP4762413.1 glycosyltransferase family 2 protein [Salibacteraceae bacterium]MDP4843582.1 glycosyltransferase family 2 protein [Salibacteraceae bacterium]MDP4934016.1 glycosyltransferase family 2 protein [Salibacteraceae bacterium]